MIVYTHEEGFKKASRIVLALVERFLELNTQANNDR